MIRRVLISTGGSGGHVVPATILYEHLKNQFHVSMSTDYRGMKFLDIDKYKLEIFNKILVLTLGPTEQVRLSGLQHFKKGVRTASCVRSSVLRSSSSRARSRSCLDASSRI